MKFLVTEHFMSSHLQDLIDRQIAELYRVREEACRSAWFLTHPAHRHQLIQVVRGFDDWALACNISSSMPT